MKFYLLCFISFLLYSCKTVQPIEYLGGNKTDTAFKQEHPVRLIQKDDQLSIRLQSINKEASSIYNIEDASSSSANSTGFIVDRDGNVLLPQLGIIKAAGLSIAEFRNELRDRADKFLTGVFVTVAFAGCRVSILGEVNKPGTIQMQQCNLSVVEALAEAADVKESGDKKNISLIRTTEGEVKTIKLDVTQISFLQSPYYFLNPGDILIVNQDQDKLKKTKDGFAKTVNITASIFSIFSAVLLLVLNLTSK